jgi:hypothetical protein
MEQRCEGNLVTEIQEKLQMKKLTDELIKENAELREVRLDPCSNPPHQPLTPPLLCSTERRWLKTTWSWSSR